MSHQQTGGLCVVQLRLDEYLDVYELSAATRSHESLTPAQPWRTFFGEQYRTRFGKRLSTRVHRAPVADETASFQPLVTHRGMQTLRTLRRTLCA